MGCALLVTLVLGHKLAHPLPGEEQGSSDLVCGESDLLVVAKGLGGGRQDGGFLRQGWQKLEAGPFKAQPA